MIEIREKYDLKPGDILRVTVDGDPDKWLEGPLTVASSGTMYLGGLATIRFSDGDWHDGYVFDLDKCPAKRESKPLPTEEGAFIFVDAVTHDVDQRVLNEHEKFEPTWAYRDEYDSWRAPDWDLLPEQIVAWRPAELREVTSDGH